ncbi:hypothetical protein HRbin36_01885 [bacterium HR36]|nr:hypothetical protein HRbin36_01885 [bacterium HR36]
MSERLDAYGERMPPTPDLEAGGRSDTDEPIGLLAGSGQLPLAIAVALKKRNQRVVCVFIREEADAQLQKLCWRFYWAGLTKLGRMIRCFRREGVVRIILAGKVHKARMFTPWRAWRLLPDWRGIVFWLFRREKQDHRDDALTLQILREFERDGMTFEPAVKWCPELLAPAGILTRRPPTSEQWADIRFGWRLAREIGRLDIGQSILVKERAVLAVEALEGTDRAIVRAGELCPAGGFTLVKVAKPQQDPRFDLPTIGPDTVQVMHRAGGRVIAIEAGKTIVLDREQTLCLADRLGLVIVALRDEQVAACLEGR